MLRLNAKLRSRCCACGTLMRVDLGEMVARHGPGHGLIDRLDRCRMVGCAGSVFYLAARAHGQDWTMLVRDADLLARFADLPPVRTAALA